VRGYGLVVAVLVGGALLLFGLAEWAAMPLLTGPLPAMRGAGVAAAFLGLGLLTADVVLPVAASAGSRPPWPASPWGVADGGSSNA
jgi:hypothetical protein